VGKVKNGYLVRPEQLANLDAHQQSAAVATADRLKRLAQCRLEHPGHGIVHGLSAQLDLPSKMGKPRCSEIGRHAFQAVGRTAC
jgi:hypothetical protein